MPRKKDNSTQLSFDFDKIIEKAEVLSGEQVAEKANVTGYDPVEKTTEYMHRTVKFEESWETTVQQARNKLLQQDARQIYFDFLTDLCEQIENGSPKSERYAELIDRVAIQGFGMSREEIHIESPYRGGSRWRVQFNKTKVERHLDSHIVGKKFLNEIKIDENLSDSLSIGSSDVSQHRSAVPFPSRFFKRAVPFVLNNAAGTLFRMQDGKARYDNLFKPKPDEEMLRWMLIDPSYQDELNGEDYQRCLASAMDVGQYRFDHEFLLKSDYRPTVILRDGSLFPQDAYLDNFIILNKRGEFIREAIRELLDCLNYAKSTGTVYCGVSKAVRLRVYSAVTDWYIAQYIDKSWEVGNYTLNDGQAMTLLLSSPDFVGDNLNEAITTCLIKRSFTTRANLNVKARTANDFNHYFQNYEWNHPHEAHLIPDYKALCGIAHLYMFFVGHAKSPQQQLPRYEFFYDESLGDIEKNAAKILASLQHCGLTVDYDHSLMSTEPITYLLPTVAQQAHILSKDVGRQIDQNTKQWIMARYAKSIDRK
jgi:hypothetical protein